MIFRQSKELVVKTSGYRQTRFHFIKIVAVIQRETGKN